MLLYAHSGSDAAKKNHNLTTTVKIHFYRFTREVMELKKTTNIKT